MAKWRAAKPDAAKACRGNHAAAESAGAHPARSRSAAPAAAGTSIHGRAAHLRQTNKPRRRQSRPRPGRRHRSPQQNPEPSKPEALPVPPPPQHGPAQEEKRAAARPATGDLNMPRPDRTDLPDTRPPLARMPSGIVSGDLLPPTVQTAPANTPPAPAEEIPPCPRVSGFKADVRQDHGRRDDTRVGAALSSPFHSQRMRRHMPSHPRLCRLHV